MPPTVPNPIQNILVDALGNPIRDVSKIHDISGDKRISDLVKKALQSSNRQIDLFGKTQAPQQVLETTPGILPTITPLPEEQRQRGPIGGGFQGLPDDQKDPQPIGGGFQGLPEEERIPGPIGGGFQEDPELQKPPGPIGGGFTELPEEHQSPRIITKNLDNDGNIVDARTPEEEEEIDRIAGVPIGNGRTEPTTHGAVTIDNENGIGAVPMGQEIGWKGFVTELTPQQFLSLNPKLSEINPKVVESLAAGEPMGSPFIQIKEISKEDEFTNQRFEVVGHEGRSRMGYLNQLQPDTPIPVHVFVGNRRVKSGDAIMDDNLSDADVSRILSEGVRQDKDAVEKPQFMPLGDKAVVGGFQRDRRIVDKSIDDEIENLKNQPLEPIQSTGLRSTVPKPSWSEDRVRKIRKRKFEVGQPQNGRVVFTDDIGAFVINGNAVSGLDDPKFIEKAQDWTDRAEGNMTPGEIENAANWYKNALSEFNSVFGEQDGESMLIAWQLANQNRSPSGALQDVLKIDEMLKGATLLKRAGLAHDNIIKILTGKVVDSGVGIKLHDFLDSAEQRNTRVALNDEADMGSPYVVDIHTARGSGYVDPVLLKYIENRFGSEAASELVIDFKDGPSESQYDRGSEWGNLLTQHLNRIGWMGKKDWRTEQVQAVDWFSIQMAINKSPESIQDTIDLNTTRIAAEIAFGSGSPLDNEFGFGAENPVFYNLTPIQQGIVSKQMFDKWIPAIAETAKVRILENQYAPGGFKADGEIIENLSSQIDILGTPDGVADFADMFGEIANQTEVWRTQSRSTGKKLALDIIEKDGKLKNEAIRKEFWDKVQDRAPNLGEGYRTYDSDGENVFEIIFKSKGINGADQAIEENKEALNNIAKEMGLTLDYDRVIIDLKVHGNDWRKNPDGRSYRQGLGKRGRSQVQESGIIDNLREEYKEDLRRAILAHIQSDQSLSGSQPESPAATPEVSTEFESRFTELNEVQ